MASPSAEELLRQVEAFKASDPRAIPENLRARLAAALRECGYSIETPTDALTRVLITQPVESISVRIATELHLFSTLDSQPRTVEQLAQATGAEPELLERVLRALGAFHAVKEVGPRQFAASPAYALFKDKNFEEAFGGCQNILNKSRQGLPSHLSTTGYKNPLDPLNTAVQHSYGTPGKSYMESLMSDPASANALRDFVTLMSVWAEGFTQISEIYPVEERLVSGFDPATVLFLDVGGGLGQKAVALRKTFSEPPGRFIVQDTGPVIANVPKDDPAYKDIEMTVHDFFTPQPVVGARCYYIRQCLHNWPDEACVKILQQLKQAAKPGYTRILIHEIVVPEQGAGPWVVSQDFNMMSMFAVGERTEQQWRDLCQQAGLKVTQVYLNDHPSREGIVEAEV